MDMTTTLPGMPQELLGGRLPAVGGTPLVPVRLRTGRRWHPVWLKLEQFNPGGSIKDRTAWSLIADLEARGALRPGGAVVESTSGNLGVGLALACRERGYRLIAVVDQMASARSVREMTDSGAVIDTVTPGPGEPLLACRLSRVAELLRADPDLVWTNQYASPANPGVHREQTATEICRQLGRPPGAVAVAVSTGGTLRGIAEHLRACAPGCQVIAVDTEGSVVLGGEPGPRHIPGIGSSRPSDFLRARPYDHAAYVSEATAAATCHALRDRTGIGVGGSSGAVLAAAARFLRGRAPGEPVVCVCADGADRYEDTVYDAGWLARNEIVVTSALPLPFDDITPG
jgi:cysteine synthase A